jgi:indolepyruvate ferredoxin oxidoreductase alpha subunit
MLAEQRLQVPPPHQLLAPTLLRSQVLAQLYGDVRAGSISRTEASRRLDHLRGLQIRLLGDRVLQRLAWGIAERLQWPDTFVAEYLALTQLQADALVIRDAALRAIAGTVVRVATPEALFA